MKITQSRLREIILEEAILMEQLVQKPKNETSPIDDEILKVLLSISASENLNEALLSDEMKERVRKLVDKLGGGAKAIANVARRLAIPLALVTSIAAGGAAGSYFSSDDASSEDDIELSVKDDSQTELSRLAGSGYGEDYHGLSNQEKINKAWEQFNLDDIERAPVSSEISMFKYAVISSDQIDGNTILPSNGLLAKDYYDVLKEKVQSNPNVELSMLRNMVFGEVSNWLSGTGNQWFKKSGDYNILPPAWSVAHAVYSDLVEESLTDLNEYLETASPEDRDQIYSSLGVNSDQEYYKFYDDQMFKIGR